MPHMKHIRIVDKIPCIARTYSKRILSGRNANDKISIMVSIEEAVCPKCGGKLKYYDSVQRILRTKDRKMKWIDIRRLRCYQCNAVHRELPDFVSPYKQYESEVIQGVLDGIITPETIGYEDYPCEMTMQRWKKESSRK